MKDGALSLGECRKELTMKISENKTKHVSPLITGFLILAAIIVTIGSLYYRYAINSYGIQVNNQLSAIADLKVGQIEQWRQERLVDATIVYRNAGFSDLVKRYFQDPKDKDVIKSIRSLMQLVYRSESFDAVSLLDTFYARKIDFPESAKRYNPVVSRQSAALMRSKKQVVFEDFYQRDAQQIFLDVFVPILDNDDSTRIIGVFEMRINPKDNIYPMLNAWPTPSKTAEILILRREGDEIVYLKGPEISKNELLKQRIPVSGTIGDGENEAASGKNKIIEGLDSHGIPVIAAVFGRLHKSG
jgi:hypothetical protein